MKVDWKLIMKITTGIIVVPIAIASNTLWPWWQKAPIFSKVVSAPLVFPVVLFSYIANFWWDSL
jgi:hypothetical protein